MGLALTGGKLSVATSLWCSEAGQFGSWCFVLQRWIAESFGGIHCLAVSTFGFWAPFAYRRWFRASPSPESSSLTASNSNAVQGKCEPRRWIWFRHLADSETKCRFKGTAGVILDMGSNPGKPRRWGVSWCCDGPLQRPSRCKGLWWRWQWVHKHWWQKEAGLLKVFLEENHWGDKRIPLNAVLSSNKKSSMKMKTTYPIFFELGILKLLVFSSGFFVIFQNLGQAVRNLFSKTSAQGFDVLLASTHDIAWSYGPFGEVFGTYAFAFLGSSSGMESAGPMDDCVPQPLPNEPSVSIDWALPMTENAQAMFFKRVLSTWNRSTASFPVAMKKKYRLNGEELQNLRNVIVLFEQLWPHISTRLPADKVKSWEEDIASNSKRDADMIQLLNTRPPRFSLSMLISEQDSAKKTMLDNEQKRIDDKESQQAEVDAAQWSFFKGALKRDHAKMELAQSAPRLVKQKLHHKQVQHRQKLVAEGEHACKGYQDLWSSQHQFPWDQKIVQVWDLW